MDGRLETLADEILAQAKRQAVEFELVPAPATAPKKARRSRPSTSDARRKRTTPRIEVVTVATDIEMCPVHLCNTITGATFPAGPSGLCPRHEAKLSLQLAYQLTQARKYGRDPKVLSEAVKQVRRRDEHWSRILIIVEHRGGWLADPVIHRLRENKLIKAARKAWHLERSTTVTTAWHDGITGARYDSAASFLVALPWVVELEGEFHVAQSLHGALYGQLPAAIFTCSPTTTRLTYSQARDLQSRALEADEFKPIDIKTTGDLFAEKEPSE